jgi:hypothetical protein
VTDQERAEEEATEQALDALRRWSRTGDLGDGQRAPEACRTAQRAEMAYLEGPRERIGSGLESPVLTGNVSPGSLN